MKRNKSRKVVPIVYKRSVYYFPLIMCIKEKIAIGVSKTPVKLKYSTGNMVKSKDKVILQHWKSDVAEFREGYFIDFTSKKNNTKGVNINKINENEQCFNECENDINETDSIASDISFSSKNTMQIKEICLKIKREKNRIYENAVELMTENEIEIKAIKNENEDLKYALSKYEEEFIRIKSYLKDRHDINIDENEIFNIEEKSNENSETYNSNFQKNLNMNTENSLKKDIKAIGNNNDINSEYKNLGSLGDFPLNYEVVKVNDENHNIDRNNNMNYIQNELKIISEKKLFS